MKNRPPCISFNLSSVRPKPGAVFPCTPPPVAFDPSSASGRLKLNEVADRSSSTDDILAEEIAMLRFSIRRYFEHTAVLYTLMKVLVKIQDSRNAPRKSPGTHPENDLDDAGTAPDPFFIPYG